ncbi:MAG: RecX family transcriptional regulator [Micrococcales bacterium]|nr:RecX family transcriptional regulator [Micrococcales bacterium]
MTKRGVPPEVAERVLDRFEEVGLVDDQAYADMLVRTRHSERGLVGLALAQELRRRGVDDETAVAAMAQVSPDDQATKAEALAAKKLASTRGVEPQARLRRTVSMLARKGYPPGLATEVTRRLLEQEEIGD